MLPYDVLYFVSSLAYVFLWFKIFANTFNIWMYNKMSIVFILTLLQSVGQVIVWN